MISLPEVLVAFNLGLFSQVHCLGMCGGVIGALGVAVAPAARERHGMWRYALAYNGGRILSYTLGGAAVGALGAGLTAGLDFALTHLVLRVLAGAVLVMAGLSLLGVGRPGALLERGGARLWRVVQRR
ncbi:MAG: sulfite exporter TauE/SafE family protein, partial [Gammaproteobacteria bacterium]